MSEWITMGGKRYVIRTLYTEPLRLGLNRVTLRFFRIRWYDRVLGFVGALYVVAKAVR